MHEIWFWQRIVTPHMAGLALGLARAGMKVTYIAEREMSNERAALGWQSPEMRDVELYFAANTAAVARLVRRASAKSIHICQGIRGNGIVSDAQHHLAGQGLRQWVVMETVDDRGLPGIVKRRMYKRLFYNNEEAIEGILATGHTTADWIVKRGVAPNRVYSFAYFLASSPRLKAPKPRRPGPFRFLFVGQFIRRKGLDLLVRALAAMATSDFELVVVGSGRRGEALRSQAHRELGERVLWIGKVQQAEVPEIMSQADCLVLPSRFDGWGAVVSEALMVGTPVICSATCGAAGVVKASGVGGVFRAKSKTHLQSKLENEIRRRPISIESRQRLATWARALGADAGARYLTAILAHVDGRASRPLAPWCGGPEPSRAC